MAVTLVEANRMREAAVARAKGLNIKLCVAVWDDGGRLINL